MWKNLVSFGLVLYTVDVPAIVVLFIWVLRWGQYAYEIYAWQDQSWAWLQSELWNSIDIVQREREERGIRHKKQEKEKKQTNKPKKGGSYVHLISDNILTLKLSSGKTNRQNQKEESKLQQSIDSSTPSHTFDTSHMI